MTFIEKIFLPKYYNKLGIRKDTFLEIFTQLEQKEEKKYCIIETGAVRDGINDLDSNGSSTYLFDEFVNYYDGIVISFDLNQQTVNMVNSTTSDKTNVICIDSIKGIESLKYKQIYEIDLLYFSNVDNAFNHLIASIFYLKINTKIIIDNISNNKEILEFIKNEKQFEIIKHEYQIVLKYNITNVIPKIFHRNWKTKDIDYTIFKKDHVESFENYHKDYIFYLHDHDDNRNFIKDYFPWFLKIYDSYSKDIMRVDAVRYFYLLYYGGIYVDLDFECFKSFNPYIQKEVHFITDKTNNWISNAIMMSSPHQIIFKKIIVEGLLQNYKNSNVLHATGPAMIGKVVYPKYKEYIHNVALSPALFYPIRYNELSEFNIKYKNLDKDVVCVHHFAGSWIK